MKVIVLVLALSLGGVPSASAIQACPAQLGVSKDNDLDYLQKAKGHAAGNEVCVEKLLRYLSEYKNDPRTVPILLDYLVFPTTGPAIAAYHAQNPEMDKFPAVFSLVMIGESVTPQLIKFLLYGKPDQLQELNALKAYMDIYETNPLLGIKNLESSVVGEKPEIREKGHVLASQAAGLCRGEVRQQCLSAASPSG